MVQEISRLDNIMDGAINERWQDALKRVLRNIYDPNTDAKKTRSVQLTIKLTPINERRDSVSMKFEIKENLAPPIPVEQTILLEKSDSGNVRAIERLDQIPGQLSMDGSEQEPPRMADLGNIEEENETTVLRFARS